MIQEKKRPLLFALVLCLSSYEWNCHRNSWCKPYLILILEKEPVCPCSVLNKGTTGTIFITSLVWRGPWLGVKPWTSCTWCQHSTTKLSRRRFSACLTGLSIVHYFITIMRQLYTTSLLVWVNCTLLHYYYELRELRTDIHNSLTTYLAAHLHV